MQASHDELKAIVQNALLEMGYNPALVDAAVEVST